MVNHKVQGEIFGQFLAEYVEFLFCVISSHVQSILGQSPKFIKF